MQRIKKDGVSHKHFHVTTSQVQRTADVELYCDVDTVISISQQLAQFFTRMLYTPHITDWDVGITAAQPVENNTGTGQLLTHLHHASELANSSSALEQYKFDDKIDRAFKAVYELNEKANTISYFLYMLADQFSVAEAQLILKLDDAGLLSREGKLWALNNVTPIGRETHFGGLVGAIVGDKEFEGPFEAGENGYLGVKGTLLGITTVTTTRKPTGEKVSVATPIEIGTVNAVVGIPKTEAAEPLEPITTWQALNMSKGELKRRAQASSKKEIIEGHYGGSLGVDIVSVGYEETNHSTGGKVEASVSVGLDTKELIGKVLHTFTADTYDDGAKACGDLLVAPVGVCVGHRDGYDTSTWKNE